VAHGAGLLLHSTRSSPTEQYDSTTHARDLAEERYQSERRRFLSTYGVDVFELRNYHLVVDTTTASVEIVTETVRREIEAAASNKATRRPRLFVQPRRILPDSPNWAEQPPSDTMPRVGYSRPTFCSIGDHGGVLRAVARDEPLVEVELVAEGAELVHHSGPTAQQYVAELTVAAWVNHWNEKYGLHHSSARPSVGG
jgi:hypothetical protein